MPFSNLNSAWSDLARYYNNVNNNGNFIGGPRNPNVTNTQKPEQPKTKFSSFDDGLIRGGFLNTGLASARDTVRIGNFLKSPKGLLWITKQVGLQLSNPLLETRAKVTFNVDNIGGIPDVTLDPNKKPVTYAGNGLIPTRIYNLGINTLAQVPVNALGIHIMRHGLFPLPAGEGYNYEKIVKENNALSAQTANNTLAEAKSLSVGSKFAIYNSLNQLKSSSSSSSPGTRNTQLPAPGQRATINGNVIFNNKNESSNGGIFASGNGIDIVMYASPQDAANNILSQQVQSFITGGTSVSGVTVQSQNPSTPKEITSTAYTLLPNRSLQNLDKIIIGDLKGPVILSNKFGGPKSVYGIGLTTIKTEADQRTNITNNKTDPKLNLLNGFVPINYYQLSNISYNSISNKEKTWIEIDRSISSPFGESENVEITYGVSHYGNRDSLSSTRKVDSINNINIVNSNIFYSTLVDQNISNTNGAVFSNNAIDNNLNGKVVGNFGKDIIKFRLEFLNNDTPLSTNGEAINTDVLAFRAYLDDFNDGMQAKWSPYRYMGRGEEFYVYEGFTRDISVAFTIHAHSPEDMKPIYRKLNYLLSTFAPDYNASNRMRGNIGYLTVGDYLYRQPGVFTDIKLTGMLDAHWEINLNGDQYELPKHIKVSLSFKPIHTFLPRKVQSTKYADTPFVTIDKKAYNTQSATNRYLD